MGNSKRGASSRKLSPFLEESYHQGVIYLQQCKYDEAALHFNQGLRVEPDHPRFLHMMGLLTLMKGDVRAAKEMLTGSVKRDPRNADACSDLAAAHIQSNEVEPALTFSEKAIKSNAEHFQAYNIQGLCRYYRKEYDKSEYCLKKAIKIEPSFVEAHNNLALVYQALGDMDKGIKSAEKALLINPNYINAYVNTGNMLAALGQFDEAVDQFQKALSIEADDPRALNGLGEVYRQKGDLELAIVHFCQVLDRNPSYSLAYNNLGLVYKSVGEMDKAIDSFVSAIKVNPQDGKAPLNLGNLYFENGSDVLAKRYYQQVLVVEPSNGSAQHMLSILEGNQNASLPKEYVKDLFDGYAENFEMHLVENLEYRVPTLLREVFDQNCLKLKISTNEQFDGLLDLGCGTGLSAQAFDDIVSVSIGVEISPNMVAKAKMSGVYKEVFCLDIIDFLRNESVNKINTASGQKKFDLCIATDVLVYLGDLEPTFELLSRCLAKGAYFVFSTELTDQGDFLLQQTGRYAHSSHYFDRLSLAYGFEIVVREKVNVRKHNGKWIIGEMYILSLDN